MLDLPEVSRCLLLDLPEVKQVYMLDLPEVKQMLCCRRSLTRTQWRG